MEVPTEVIAAVLVALAGGGGFVGVRRIRNGNHAGKAADSSGERRQGQSELIQAVREGTAAAQTDSQKTRSTIHESAFVTQTGIQSLAKEQAELVGYLKAKL